MNQIETMNAIIEGSPRIHRSKPFPMPVILCGLATTALTLIGIFVLDRVAPDFNIMGLYANKILPFGAMIVGAAASCGYGIASWFSGMKITKKVMWLMFALQACAYFAAQYIEFKGMNLIHSDDGAPVGFFEYFDATARSFAWKQHDGSPGEPMGVFGYFFRGLEIIGFALGGLIVPAIMLRNPYCEGCQRYMRTRQLALIPGSVPIKKVKKKDLAGKAAHEAEQTAAVESGKQWMERIKSAAMANKIDVFQTEWDELKRRQKETLKLPGRFIVELIHCQSCRAGKLNLAFMIANGQNIQRNELEQAPVSEEFVRLFRNK